MKTIMQGDKKGICFICKKHCDTQVHHIFGGTANRKKSEDYGLKVNLCRECHTGDTGVHFNRRLRDILQKQGQLRFEELYGHDCFMRMFGKNYL